MALELNHIYCGDCLDLIREIPDKSIDLVLTDWKYTENIPGEGYPFQPAVTLWEMGLVPSFDGRTWRLHGGPDGRVLWEDHNE